MTTSMVYHGGSSGKLKGWPAGGSSGPNPDTIRYVLEEKSWHYSNTNPISSNLHTVPNDALYGYKTPDFNQGLGAFATFALPHKDWSRVLTGTTGINLDFFFYGDTSVAAPNNIGYFNVEMYIVRPGETVNFAKSAGVFMTLDFSVPAYQMIGYRFSNMQVTDPAATGAAGWCIFYIKCRRQTAGTDTYTNTCRMLGAVVEFPLV